MFNFLTRNYDDGMNGDPAKGIEDIVRRNVAALRSKANLTQQGLADEMLLRGITWTRETVAQVETTNRRLGFTEAIAVAACLDVPIARLTATGCGNRGRGRERVVGGLPRGGTGRHRRRRLPARELLVAPGETGARRARARGRGLDPTAGAVGDRPGRWRTVSAAGASPSAGWSIRTISSGWAGGPSMPSPRPRRPRRRPNASSGACASGSPPAMWMPPPSTCGPAASRASGSAGSPTGTR